MTRADIVAFLKCAHPGQAVHLPLSEDSDGRRDVQTKAASVATRLFGRGKFAMRTKGGQVTIYVLPAQVPALDYRGWSRVRRK